jgi:hypothetical protein
LPHAKPILYSLVSSPEQYLVSSHYTYPKVGSVY